MARQPSVVIRNQFVYLLDNATINVFDCIDNNTGQRDIYYIQKGRIEDSVQFRETRRTPRQQQSYNNQPNWRPPHYSPSSSSSSDDEESRNNQRSNVNTDRYMDILGSRRTVTDDELKRVANKLRFEDEKYKKLALHLGLSHEDIDTTKKENENKDRTEMICSLLKLWKARSQEPSVRALGHGLENCNLKKFVVETLDP